MAFVAAMPTAARSAVGLNDAPLPVVAQQRASARAPRPTGSATITVKVVTADDGTAVKGARIILDGVPAGAVPAGSPSNVLQPSVPDVASIARWREWGTTVNVMTGQIAAVKLAPVR